MWRLSDRCTTSRLGSGMLAAFAGCGTLWGLPITNGEGALLLFVVPAVARLNAQQSRQTRTGLRAQRPAPIGQDKATGC